MGGRELALPLRGLWSQHPTEQLSYHPDTHPGFRVGTLKHLSSLRPTAAHEATGPGESELQDLHDWDNRRITEVVQ